jgi:glutathione S-transferase
VRLAPIPLAVAGRRCYANGMQGLTLWEIYLSPYSERVRWVLELKGLSYTRRPYQPIADEEELRRTTGISTTPVLLADGRVVGDSDAAVDWAEQVRPTPPLLPTDPRQRAVVRSLELVATETLAPSGRLVAIGQWRAAGLQPFADHFTAKYHWSEEAEARAVATLERVLPDLANAVSASRYLVGDAFTRADLTLACMLTPVLGAPPEDLFALDDQMRGMFRVPIGKDPRVAPLRAWRDDTYRRQRGGRVVPAAA